MNTIIPRYCVKFGPWAGRIIRLALVSCLLILAALSATAGTISAETFGAIRTRNLESPSYGAGARIGYDFNTHVSAIATVTAWEADNWRGPAIDEGSIGVRAALLRSANGKLSLSAVANANHDFNDGKFGLSGGLGVSALVYGNLYAFVEEEVRFWDGKDRDEITRFGIGLKF